MIFKRFISITLSIIALLSCTPNKDKKMYKIGVITPGNTYDEIIDGLKAEVAASEFAGRIEFIIQDFPRTKDEFEAAAKIIERLKPDIVYTITTPATKAAKTVIKDLPIIFNAVGDPLGAKIIESYSKPGKNITGCTNLSAELSGKRLEYFLEAFPRLKKIITFYDPANDFSVLAAGILKDAARKFKIQLLEYTAASPGQLRVILGSLKKGGFDGIYLLPDAMTLTLFDEIAQISLEFKTPIVAHEAFFVNKGAAIAYGAEHRELGRMSFMHVKAVLSGEKPETLPVFIPESIYLTINAKLAQEMGYRVPNEVLFLAHKVIY